MDVTIALTCHPSQAVCRYPISKHNGLTLLELLVAVTILGITLGLGIPTIRAILNYNRVATSINQLSQSIALGRSEAVKRNAQIVMCKSKDHLSCSRHGSWQQGWIIFVDEEVDRERSPEEALLFSQSALPRNLYLHFAAFRSPHFITFRPTGITLMNGTFTFCIFGEPQTGKALILSKTGRVYISKTGYNGKALKCPQN